MVLLDWFCTSTAGIARSKGFRFSVVAHTCSGRPNGIEFLCSVNFYARSRSRIYRNFFPFQILGIAWKPRSMFQPVQTFVLRTFQRKEFQGGICGEIFLHLPKFQHQILNHILRLVAARHLTLRKTIHLVLENKYRTAEIVLCHASAFYRQDNEGREFITSGFKIFLKYPFKF